VPYSHHIRTAPQPDYVTGFLSSSDGLSLVKAFTHIKRRNLRSAILHLVEGLASPER
jgi:hypothetical protein